MTVMVGKMKIIVTYEKIQYAVPDTTNYYKLLQTTTNYY